MADFVQTMKDWRRMCKQYAEEEHECEGCPLEDITPHACGAIFEDEFADVADWTELEQRVMAWAKEHHEPVYPTWEEWLQSVGVMESSEGLLRRIKGQLLIDGIPAYAVPTAKVLQPMDADIAQKLGLQPKEC